MECCPQVSTLNLHSKLRKYLSLFSLPTVKCVKRNFLQLVHNVPKKYLVKKGKQLKKLTKASDGNDHYHLPQINLALILSKLESGSATNS